MVFLVLTLVWILYVTLFCFYEIDGGEQELLYESGWKRLWCLLVSVIFLWLYGALFLWVLKFVTKHVFALL